MNTKNLAIGVLSVTAVILLTGLVIVQTMLPQQAMALGNGDADSYVVSTSQLDEGTELLLVLDTAARRMNAYVFNLHLGQIELLQPPIPIDRIGVPEPPGPGGNR